MAVTNPWNQPFHSLLDSKTYPIQGKMIAVQLDVNPLSGLIDPDQIKGMLVMELVKSMMNEKVIEFTSQTDPIESKTRYRARCFVVPDSDVRILRTIGTNA